MARAAAGYTLVELLIVAALLAVIARVSIQTMGPAAAVRLDAAAGEVAAALRFARIEAMRTGRWHGVDFGAAGGERRIRVFRVDGMTAPGALYDVRHPVRKTLYDIALSAHPGALGVTLAQAQFHYASGGTVDTREWVAFDPAGTPDYYPDAIGYAAFGDATRINAATLTQAGLARRVLLDPVTGRVTAE